MEENVVVGMLKDSINEKRNNEDIRKGFGRLRLG